VQAPQRQTPQPKAAQPQTETRPAPGTSPVPQPVSGEAAGQTDTPVPVAPAQTASQAAAPPSAAANGANSEELRASRELLVMLGTRANSARKSLETLKAQQARMGTNLRGDILTAEQRMEFYLDEAQAAVRAGEPRQAKASLQTAERALELIEKFLGR
jgi:hypothetical protein